MNRPKSALWWPWSALITQGFHLHLFVLVWLGSLKSVVLHHINCYLYIFSLTSLKSSVVYKKEHMYIYTYIYSASIILYHQWLLLSFYNFFAGVVIERKIFDHWLFICHKVKSLTVKHLFSRFEGERMGWLARVILGVSVRNHRFSAYLMCFSLL